MSEMDAGSADASPEEDSHEADSEDSSDSPEEGSDSPEESDFHLSDELLEKIGRAPPPLGPGINLPNLFNSGLQFLGMGSFGLVFASDPDAYPETSNSPEALDSTDASTSPEHSHSPDASTYAEASDSPKAFDSTHSTDASDPLGPSETSYCLKFFFSAETKKTFEQCDLFFRTKSLATLKQCRGENFLTSSFRDALSNLIESEPPAYSNRFLMVVPEADVHRELTLSSRLTSARMGSVPILATTKCPVNPSEFLEVPTESGTARTVYLNVFVMEKLDGDLDELFHELIQKKKYRTATSLMSKAFATYLSIQQQLVQLGSHHGDYKLGNILYRRTKIVTSEIEGQGELEEEEEEGEEDAEYIYELFLADFGVGSTLSGARWTDPSNLKPPIPYRSTPMCIMAEVQRLIIDLAESWEKQTLEVAKSYSLVENSEFNELISVSSKKLLDELCQPIRRFSVNSLESREGVMDMLYADPDSSSEKKLINILQGFKADEEKRLVGLLWKHIVEGLNLMDENEWDERDDNPRWLLHSCLFMCRFALEWFLLLPQVDFNILIPSDREKLGQFYFQMSQIWVRYLVDPSPHDSVVMLDPDGTDENVVEVKQLPRNSRIATYTSGDVFSTELHVKVLRLEGKVSSLESDVADLKRGMDRMEQSFEERIRSLEARLLCSKCGGELQVEDA